jgi:hypothetical protein
MVEYGSLLLEQIRWAKMERDHTSTDDLDALQETIREQGKRSPLVLSKSEIGIAKVITRKSIQRLRSFDYVRKYRMSEIEAEKTRKDSIQPLESLMEWLVQAGQSS